MRDSLNKILTDMSYMCFENRFNIQKVAFNFMRQLVLVLLGTPVDLPAVCSCNDSRKKILVVLVATYIQYYYRS